MRPTIKLALLALAAGIVGLAARPALADFTVCSQYNSTIYVAYAYNDGTDWVSEGWWTLDPGGCTALESGSLKNRYYYLYAEADDGTTWGGQNMFCIHSPNEFTIWGDQDCDTGFFEIDTGNDADWTHTFTH